MTDKITEARRAAFERKYPLLEGMYWCEVNNTYAGNPLFWLYQDRWECWNSALDSVCVELPALDRQVTFDDESIDIYWPHDVIEAINQAGVRCK